jgi:hypothetical protein
VRSLVGRGRCGEEKLVGEAGEVLCGFRCQTCDAGCEPGLWSDGDFGAACYYGVVDLVSGVVDGGCDDGSFSSELEPALFFLGLACVLRVDFSAGAHEAGTYGSDSDAFVPEFGV